MYFTPSDNTLIESAVRYISSDIRLPRISNAGLRIGALRYYMGANFAPGSSSAKRVIDTYRPVLAKLVHEAKSLGNGAERELIVTRNVAALASIPEFSRLINRYVDAYNKNGFGFWRNESYEQIVFQLSARRLGESSTALKIICRADIDALLRTYREQAAIEVATEADLPAPTRVPTSEPMTQQMRKQISMDADGKCWQCDAPKPRRLQCAVCGYIPRQGRS